MTENTTSGWAEPYLSIALLVSILALVWFYYRLFRWFWRTGVVPYIEEKRRERRNRAMYKKKKRQREEWHPGPFGIYESRGPDPDLPWDEMGAIADVLAQHDPDD